MSALPQTPQDTAAETLAAWQAQAEALRACSQPAGLSRLDQIRDLSGQQLFEAMIAGKLPPPPIIETLDFMLMETSPGRAVFQGQPLFRHYNPLGTVHGGWMATLLDSCVGCAVHSSLPVGKSYTTLELKVNFVKALTEKVPLVRAIGELIHGGNRVATAEGRLVGPDGTLFAHATTTCLIFDLPTAR